MAPLFAAIEQAYPYCEVVAIVDSHRERAFVEEMLQRYYLVRVNHSSIEGVRALYRSQRRAFRRVVVVDLPFENRNRATMVASAIAAFDYLLYLQGERLLARDAVAYCANVIASQCLTISVQLSTVVGASVQLEKADREEGGDVVPIVAERVLAWYTGGAWRALCAIFLPAVLAFVAIVTGRWLWLCMAMVVVVMIGLFLYVSCCVMVERSLFVTLDTILRDFYRFLLERFKKNDYLYKGGYGWRRGFASSVVAKFSTSGENNRERL
jgi:hypothetical protein